MMLHSIRRAIADQVLFQFENKQRLKNQKDDLKRSSEIRKNSPSNLTKMK